MGRIDLHRKVEGVEDRLSTSPTRSPNMAVKLGFIKYDGGLHVNESLLSVVLHD
jgi:hypothetical protein